MNVLQQRSALGLPKILSYIIVYIMNIKLYYKRPLVIIYFHACRASHD